MIETSSSTPLPNRHKRLRWLLLASLLVAFLLVMGSNRQPADATRPIEWHQSSISQNQPPRTDVLRIATYNIHGGKGRNGKLDLSLIAQDLRDIDVAGLYEVRGSMLGSFATQGAVIGEYAGLNAAFLGTEHRWWHDHFGNAVLSKLPIDLILRIPLAGTRRKAFRQAALFNVRLDGGIVHVLMVHVDSTQDREHQLRAVIEIFQSLELPAILMGDLNTGPDDPHLRELLAQPGVESVLHAKLGDAAPKDNIDWIITRGLDCDDVGFHYSGASDHPVIKATLRLAAH